MANDQEVGFYATVGEIAARRLAYARAEEVLVLYTPFTMHMRIPDFIAWLVQHQSPTMTFTARELIGEFMMWAKLI